MTSECGVVLMRTEAAEVERSERVVLWEVGEVIGKHPSLHSGALWCVSLFLVFFDGTVSCAES